MITQLLAIGKFDNRETLNYQPVNEPINGACYNAFGVKINHPYANAERRPFKVDAQGSVTYIMFDNDANADVCIYKIVED